MTIAFVSEVTTHGLTVDDGYVQGTGYRDYTIHFDVGLPSCSAGDLLIISAARGVLNGGLATIAFLQDGFDTITLDTELSYIASRLCDGSEPGSDTMRETVRVFYSGTPPAFNFYANMPVVVVAAVYSGPETSAVSFPGLASGGSTNSNPSPHTTATSTFLDQYFDGGFGGDANGPTSGFADLGSFFFVSVFGNYGTVPSSSFANVTVRGSATEKYQPGTSIHETVGLTFGDVLDYTVDFTTDNPLPAPVATWSNIAGTTRGAQGQTLLNYRHRFFTTSCSLVSDNNPSELGDAVEFADTITASDIITPTGTVEFFDGVTSLGTGTLFEDSPGVATARLTTSSLSIGSHAITAVYDGDLSFQASTCDALTQVVTSPIVVSPPPSGGRGGAAAALLAPYWGILLADGVSMPFTSPAFVFLEFEETSGSIAQDSSTFNNDGTIGSSVTLNQTGAHGRCFLFEGPFGDYLNSYVQLPSSMNLPPTPFDTCLIEANIKQVNVYVGSNARVWQGGSSGASEPCIIVNYDKIYFQLFTSLGSNVVEWFHSGEPTDGSFHLLQCDYDGSRIAIFWDGVLMASNAAGGTVDPVQFGGEWAVGNRGPAMVDPFEGYIDDFAYYPHCLAEL